jgi:hypothetical protein
MTYIDHHEAVAYETKISDLNGNYAMPFLFETPNGTWGLISEAALSTDYSGAVLKGNSNGLLDVNFHLSSMVIFLHQLLLYHLGALLLLDHLQILMRIRWRKI